MTVNCVIIASRFALTLSMASRYGREARPSALKCMIEVESTKTRLKRMKALMCSDQRQRH
eukprot:6173910-Pleurochrysis_carterae.AAC.3